MTLLVGARFRQVVQGLIFGLIRLNILISFHKCTALLVGLRCRSSDRSINNTLSLIELNHSELRTIAKHRKRPPYGSCLSFLHEIIEIYHALCLSGTGPPAFAISDNRSIPGVALCHFQHFLTAPGLGVPCGDFRFTLTVIIDFKLFGINRPLRAQQSEPDEPPLHREIVFLAILARDLDKMLIRVEITKRSILIGLYF